ncbi:MAG: transcription elongation factor GreA, partial [Candidatus Kaiserbacteria bacterium]|nr:transcription elongation factor GreA [Candidatus Kaiserbacteria bacterium]
MADIQDTVVSQEKFDEMIKELENLKTVRRTEIAKNLEYARALGDLSENAEYQEARDLQAATEERIKKLEELV